LSTSLNDLTLVKYHSNITLNLVMICAIGLLTSLDGSRVQVARFKQLTLYLQATQLSS